MSRLREDVLRYMRLIGFSPKTFDSYIHALEELARLRHETRMPLSYPCRTEG